VRRVGPSPECGRASRLQAGASSKPRRPTSLSMPVEVSRGAG
jgi:hypothetical protein